MSDWSDTCDAVATDLLANVAALATAVVHKYEPWEPDQITPDARLHLGIWPSMETAEEVEESYMGSAAVELVQTYQILVWEAGATEGTQRVRNETSAATFLTLHNAVRQRLNLRAQAFAGAYLTRLADTEFPSRLEPIRWFRIAFTSRRAAPLI